MNRDKSLIDLQNERNERRAIAQMTEIARSLNIPDDGWYVSVRRQKDKPNEYHGDWTALGLIWLLNMDDRRLRSIIRRVTKSSLDNKGVGVGWCRIEFFDGTAFESEGTATYGDAPAKGYAYCDEVAETRAFKRAAVLATGKGIIDHPTGGYANNGEVNTIAIQPGEDVLSDDDRDDSNT